MLVGPTLIQSPVVPCLGHGGGAGGSTCDVAWPELRRKPGELRCAHRNSHVQVEPLFPTYIFPGDFTTEELSALNQQLPFESV